nr:PepSY domain-containing protein [Lysinibacillus timonensis]
MKKVILVPLLLGVMGIGGVIALAGGHMVSSASEVSLAQIKTKALSEVNGTIREVEVERKGNKKYYGIEIVTENAKYDLIYDAATGELVKKQKDEIDDDLINYKNVETVNNEKSNQYKDDLDDDINENDDKKDKPVSNTQSIQKQTSTTIPKQQTPTTPTPNINNKDDDYDDYYDDDLYDDDYEDRYDDDISDDDDNDLYDDDQYENDDDDDDDDERYEDDDDDDNDD